MNSSTIEILAPAKVNYRLDVLSRRPDGYHELRMIMQRIDLCDTISVSTSETPGIRVNCGHLGVPENSGNIAWRAADRLLSLTASPPGIDIQITKRIPVAAGLGGGSSDAAAVLNALNSLLKINLPTEQLMEIGVSIGADVPFFIFGKTALALGIGEKLTPIVKIPALWMVLVNPNIHVSTAWVFKNLQLTSSPDIHKMPDSFENIEEVCAILGNDLEKVTAGRYPVICTIKEHLLNFGASAALMSGSGPTVFGIFKDDISARHAADMINAETGWFTAAVKTI